MRDAQTQRQIICTRHTGLSSETEAYCWRLTVSNIPNHKHLRVGIVAAAQAIVRDHLQPTLVQRSAHLARPLHNTGGVLRVRCAVVQPVESACLADKTAVRLFFEFSLCLSPACLGKMIMNGSKSPFFQVDAKPPGPRQGLLFPIAV